MNALVQRNKKLILKTFYTELKENGFSLTVFDGELMNSINSFQEILDLYNTLDAMSIKATKDDFKASASFIFDNGSQGVCCLSDYSVALEPFIIKTNELIDKLAN